MTQMKAALGGIPVQRAMVTDFQTLSAEDSLARAIEYLLAGSQQDFPVVERGNIVGILTRSDLLVAIAKEDQQAPVASVMQRDFQVSHANESLEAAFIRLKGCDCQTMPVVRNGAIIGLLTKENVGEFLMVQAALGKKKTAS